jgi:hypothetical protein
MCYLGVLGRRNLMDLDTLRNAFDHNSDGFGTMYAQGGKVITWKHKGPFEDFAAHWATLPDNRSVAVHFRFGTSGPSNADACHPFEVLNKERDGMDLWLMHNGVLDYRKFPGGKKNSDTMQYVARLRSMLVTNPLLIRNAAFRDLLEEELGNPNKMVLLEGNGRWHYLNKHQGEEEGRIWHSNTYSLKKVFSGFGKGKLARCAPAWSEDDWDLYNTGTFCGTRNDAGHIIQAPTTLKSYSNASARDELTWALQIVRFNGKADEQIYWMKGYTGWLRMARNPSTGGYYRDFPKAGEARGCDIVATLPSATTIKFRPKNEAAWMRGEPHTWTMEKGEHVPVPLTTSNAVTVVKQTSAAGAALPSVILDESAAYLCRETNEPCVMGCTTQCTGAGANDTGATFPQSQDATRNAARTITDTLAQLDAREEEEREEEAREIAYLDQLFSEQNLRTMSYEDMLDAINDYPEEGACALGRLLNLKWAWEDAA